MLISTHWWKEGSRPKDVKLSGAFAFQPGSNAAAMLQPCLALRISWNENTQREDQRADTFFEKIQELRLASFFFATSLAHVVPGKTHHFSLKSCQVDLMLIEEFPLNSIIVTTLLVSPGCFVWSSKLLHAHLLQERSLFSSARKQVKAHPLQKPPNRPQLKKRPPRTAGATSLTSLVTWGTGDPSRFSGLLERNAVFLESSDGFPR